ncbi:MAG TPA: ribonuclease HII [Gammaproteobacteria bacterium]|jgi:ribonuclease HII|nr:ribonuclease HII [Gammaproteobacteria bacterium]
MSLTMVVAGVDEAGRGPLAGPVMAAAVVLDAARPIRGLKDSKLLDPERREELAAQIRERSRAWAVAWADHEEIDRINILQASLLAMARAVAALAIEPEQIFVDGNQLPPVRQKVTTVVQGDLKLPAIGAASILAKVERDAAMRRLHAIYPQYGFDEHKGYSTPAHLAALNAHGACAVHRRSFEPVRRCLDRLL